MMTDTPTLRVARRREFRDGWPTLLAASLGCACGLSALPFYSLGSFIAPLQAEFGWGRGDIASSFLYTTLVLAMISPLLGALVDRIGVRPIALASIPLLASVLALISHYQGSPMGFHLLYALAALVAGGTTPINYTRAVNAYFDKGRGLALGLCLGGMGIIAIVLPPLLAAVIQARGWRDAYIVLALLALLPWPFVLLGMRRGSIGSASITPQAGVTMQFAVRTSLFWIIGLTFSAVAVAVSALVVHMAPLLRDAGLDAVSAARVASVIGVGVLCGRVLVGYVIDRFFAPHATAVTLLATALGCLLLLLVGRTMAPVAAFLIGLSLGAEVDVIAYLTARYFGMARYGILYAIIYAMFVVGAAVGPAIAGALFDLTGSYVVPLWCIFALLVISAITLLRLPRFNVFAAHWRDDAPAAALTMGRHPVPGE